MLKISRVFYYLLKGFGEVNMKAYISVGHKAAIFLIGLSILVGFIYGFVFEDIDQIKTIGFDGLNVLETFFQIFSIILSLV
ncbi:hypothetical protein [Paenibacillus larvae]|uniref:hypothetical protein n=2 Tax=Paenibacillus larvae TaxID=1464 RepID=UPI0022812C53|nr:hypothetical protein [Paenibacillus larvae]MCY9775093.1 hypothetical protein [Paenibacillus larvae]